MMMTVTFVRIAAIGQMRLGNCRSEILCVLNAMTSTRMNKMSLLLKYGCTRNVIILKHVVIKIPTFKQYNLFLRGILANLQEKQFSGIHPDLAKVKWCSPLGLILVMEKATTLDSIIANKSWLSFYDELQSKYKDDKLKEFLLSDCKPSNWGYIKSRLVKIDYGD